MITAAVAGRLGAQPADGLFESDVIAPRADELRVDTDEVAATLEVVASHCPQVEPASRGRLGDEGADVGLFGGVADRLEPAGRLDLAVLVGGLTVDEVGSGATTDMDDHDQEGASCGRDDVAASTQGVSTFTTHLPAFRGRSGSPRCGRADERAQAQA